jgi:hypothetical protein
MPKTYALEDLYDDIEDLLRKLSSLDLNALPKTDKAKLKEKIKKDLKKWAKVQDKVAKKMNKLYEVG